MRDSSSWCELYIVFAFVSFVGRSGGGVCLCMRRRVLSDYLSYFAPILIYIMFVHNLHRPPPPPPPPPPARRPLLLPFCSHNPPPPHPKTTKSCYPISGATWISEGYLLQKVTSSNVGALSVVFVLILRLYSGWGYIGSRCVVLSV
jgi:hypothetical protein